MVEWYDALSVLQKLFVIIATVGTTAFLIQFVMMMLGGDDPDGPDLGGGDVDVAGDVDFDGDPDAVGDMDAAEEAGHVDSDVGFKLLSLQSLSAFLMMFGLVGLAVSKGGYGALPSMGSGLLVGFLMMYGVAKAFALFRSLQNSGTIQLKNAIGAEARVYLTIKPDEAGQIEVIIQGHLGIYDAQSKDHVEIPTDSRVKVVGVVNNMMYVVKVDAEERTE